MKILVLAVMAALSAAPALASPCGDRIAALEKRFNAQAPAVEAAPVAPGLAGSAPETTSALLHHQPTVGSVANAEKSADSPEAVRSATFKVAIEQARAANNANDPQECEANANDAEKALKR